VYHTSSCMYGGTCVDGINSFQCVCMGGYSGTNCQHWIRACDSSPCRNHATCTNQVAAQGAPYAFLCHCTLGFAGALCDTFVDWCGDSAGNPCRNGATCKNVFDQFECLCAPGWTGLLCDVPRVTCDVAAKEKGKLTLY